MDGTPPDAGASPGAPPDAGAADVRARIQHLLVTGDNRLKQDDGAGGPGAAVARARESWEAALALAREAGLEERVRPLVELRLADADRLG